MLVRHQIPATLYLATAFIDEQRPFPYGAPPMSWAAVRDAVATGLVTVGSHTHTHALLDRLPHERVDEELDRSIGAIEEHLGVTPAHFAYPKSVAPSLGGGPGGAGAFRSAALAGTRPNRVRPHRSVPARPLADPGRRRHALVPGEGRGRHGASRTTLRRVAQPLAVRREPSS